MQFLLRCIHFVACFRFFVPRAVIAAGKEAEIFLPICIIFFVRLNVVDIIVALLVCIQFGLQSLGCLLRIFSRLTKIFRFLGFSVLFGFFRLSDIVLRQIQLTVELIFKIGKLPKQRGDRLLVNLVYLLSEIVKRNDDLLIGKGLRRTSVKECDLRLGALRDGKGIDAVDIA